MDWQSLHGKAFENQCVLVTGAAGFIGSHLVEALVHLGAQVVAMDDLSRGRWENLTGFDTAVTKVTGSILDNTALAQALPGCRYVFHMAALGSVPVSVEQPRLYHEVNVTGTLNLLEAARKVGVRRVVFAASSSAYGDPPAADQPKVETMPALPRSPYAATKVAGEALLRAWAISYGLDTVSLRYFNIFGPRQDPQSAYAAVIAAFAKAMHQGRAGTIYGDGSQSRDFTYVANTIHANLLAARREPPFQGEVINIAMGRRTTVNELHRRMAACFGLGQLMPHYAPPRHGDVAHSLADISRARQGLGYEPLLGFEDGLRETCDWYKKNL